MNQSTTCLLLKWQKTVIVGCREGEVRVGKNSGGLAAQLNIIKALYYTEGTFGSKGDRGGRGWPTGHESCTHFART